MNRLLMLLKYGSKEERQKSMEVVLSSIDGNNDIFGLGDMMAFIEEVFTSADESTVKKFWDKLLVCYGEEKIPQDFLVSIVCGSQHQSVFSAALDILLNRNALLRLIGAIPVFQNRLAQHSTNKIYQPSTMSKNEADVESSEEPMVVEYSDQSGTDGTENSGVGEDFSEKIIEKFATWTQTEIMKGFQSKQITANEMRAAWHVYKQKGKPLKTHVEFILRFMDPKFEKEIMELGEIMFSFPNFTYFDILGVMRKAPGLHQKAVSLARTKSHNCRDLYNAIFLVKDDDLFRILWDDFVKLAGIIVKNNDEKDVSSLKTCILRSLRNFAKVRDSAESMVQRYFSDDAEVLTYIMKYVFLEEENRPELLRKYMEMYQNLHPSKEEVLALYDVVNGSVRQMVTEAFPDYIA